MNCSKAQNVEVLENDLIKAVFNLETGALTALVNKKTGWEIQGHLSLARSFRIFVPLPDRIFNVVNGEKQDIMDVQTSADGSRLTFVWGGLESEHDGLLDIKLVASVILENVGMTFQMEIDNRSPYRIESIAYPLIGDIQRPKDCDHLSRASFFHTSLLLKSLYPEFQNERGYWGVESPIQLIHTPANPFLIILADDQGLYIGHHDTSAKERVDFTFQLIPGYGRVGYVLESNKIGGEESSLEFRAEHFPFIQPGETYTLSPIVFKPFSGDWHTGADIYKAWRNTWMEKPSSPKWLHEVHSWQQIQLSSWGDTLNIKYKELEKRGEECAKHGVGAIQLTGWTLYGQDGRLPIHDIDPRMGTKEDLQKTIQRIQNMGVKVVLYEKYTCTDISTDWYKDELYKYASKDIFGNTHGHEGWRYDTPAHLAGINIRPYAWMCMNSEHWQEIALEEIRKSLEFDPDGILLDECQWHGTNAFYCFDENHGHRIPAYNFAGDANFEKKLRRVLETKNIDMVLAGEAPYDLQNRYYSLTYHRAGEGHVPVLRYIDPYQPIINWVHGYDDRESINFCLLFRYIISYEPRNFRGFLEEFPLTLEYGKKVDTLRQRYRAYLWDAEFRDTMGASVTVGGEPHPLYSVFFRPLTDEKTIIIANHSCEEIRADVDAYGINEFIVVTPENMQPQKIHTAVTIQPRSIVVLLPANPIF